MIKNAENCNAWFKDQDQLKTLLLGHKYYAFQENLDHFEKATCEFIQ